MQLTLWTGIFWLLIASTIGETIVRSAKALARGRQRTLPTTADPNPELLRRVAELEATVAVLTDALELQERDLSRLREQQEFTERLLAARSEPRLPG